jgi:hypothetical protein
MESLEPVKHIESFTDQEKTQLVDFWRAYLLSGGEGEPSAFQLEALNQPDFRDGFLFWQVGGSAEAENFYNPDQTEWFYRAFGPLPSEGQDVSVLKALYKVLEFIPPEDDTLDTGTVVVIAVTMWALRMGKYEKAATLIEKATEVNALDAFTRGTTPHHASPLRTLGVVTQMLPMLPTDSLKRALVGALLGLPTAAKEEGDENKSA